MGVSVLRLRAVAFAIALLAGLAAAPASAVRVKDIASVKGVRENQVIGYGLVVGLNGTGDKEGTEFTVRSLSSLLAKLGIGVDPEEIRVKNVAAVMVTSMLPPFSRNGSRIDALVSSMGDAKSLQGGTLVMTPLFGTDGQVYAIAQGPISVGGFSEGSGGSNVQKNHPTVGRIAQGATVERELAYSIEAKGEFELALAEPDFTTALRTAKAINDHFQLDVADAVDAGTLRLYVPYERSTELVWFMAEVESVEVDPDTRARIVLNERTGTVVIGADVRIETVAVSHGSLSVTISTTREPSQPAPFSDAGETVVVENADVEAIEEDARLTLVKGPVTIAELVQGLNAIGVSPRDLIAILQAIKAAGAMSADLELL